MSVLAAILKIYEEVPGEDNDVINDIAHDYLTENTCRNGRTVLWYMNETRSIAMYLDTYEFLTEEEIEKELY